ncbi:MAG TPA: bifunctional riboflavin kinase/FAD synthetase, partial [Chloroflexia bacterium]|nr:bifunctional riboflavin kinase/FAD synthetase [Chloroflexia bacterium]
DGVHVAHRALISGAVMAAREHGVPAAVLSFDPHPDSVVRPDRPMIYLTDLDDKAALIKEIGADILIIQPFTPEFARIPAEDFVNSLLQLADIQEIHVGEDFAFGFKAQGNVARLREWGHQKGFKVKSLAPLEVDDEIVSSSRIRQLLQEGAVDRAGRLLGRPYSLKGVVIHGNERGRLLGFPTANMTTEARFAVPSNGVYATMTTFLDTEPDGPPRPSVTNIGVRPTFDNGARSVETFVLDWSGDLYDQTIRVEFIEKLRDERKFSGIEEIKAQLGRDVENSRNVLAKFGF